MLRLPSRVRLVQSPIAPNRSYCSYQTDNHFVVIIEPP